MTLSINPAAENAGREEIEREQLQSLQQLFQAIVPANRFYTRKLQAAGAASAPRSLDEFFERVPFTRKQELVEDQKACPPYGTDLTYPLERYVRFNQTSGTTGTPIRWLDTPESWSWMVGNWMEVFRASGVGPGDRILFAFSFGPFLGFWTAFEAGARLGCLCLPGGGMSSAARLQLIRDHQATVLCCTPTYAMRLGEAAAESSQPEVVRSVRNIIVAGEPGAGIPSTRACIERHWPLARLWDHHGMTETGPVTFECAARPGTLHVCEPAYLAEVVEPEGDRAVGSGEEGELVLTSLGRVGSPLIRYRTGDRVKRAADAVCACGRSSLALAGGILGRTDDMVVVRGVNLFPSAFEDVLRRFDEIAEYRVEVHTGDTLTEISVHVEPARGCADPLALAREAESALRTSFHLRVPVVIVEEGSLPRFELKAKRWVRRHAGTVGNRNG